MTASQVILDSSHASGKLAYYTLSTRGRPSGIPDLIT